MSQVFNNSPTHYLGLSLTRILMIKYTKPMGTHTNIYIYIYIYVKCPSPIQQLIALEMLSIKSIRSHLIKRD